MIVHPDFLEKAIGHFYRRQQPPSGRQKSLQQVSSFGALVDLPPPQQQQMEEGRLQRRQLGAGEAAGGGLGWVPKSKAAFLQIPQDYFNVDANDPMVSPCCACCACRVCCACRAVCCQGQAAARVVNPLGRWIHFLPRPPLPRCPSCLPQVHCARFFYGPMLQGRDGIGAAPCCGTGVIFRKDILMSIGGQAYGSITEDYNTAMTLLSAGFATM